MIEILIIGFITYYVTLFVVVYKCNLKEMLNCEKPRIELPPEPETAPDDLINKGSFVWKEPEPPTEPPTSEKEEEKTEETEKTETEEGKKEEPETEEGDTEEGDTEEGDTEEGDTKGEINPETEYYEEEEEEPETEETGDEQEQFENLRETESLSSVQNGVTSDNINQVISVIKNNDATEEEERKAANNITAMQNDQILQTIINTTNAEDRVNYLLKKRLNEYYKNRAAMEADNNNSSKDYQNFNIKNYA